MLICYLLIHQSLGYSIKYPYPTMGCSDTLTLLTFGNSKMLYPPPPHVLIKYISLLDCNDKVKKICPISGREKDKSEKQGQKIRAAGADDRYIVE